MQTFQFNLREEKLLFVYDYDTGVSGQCNCLNDLVIGTQMSRSHSIDYEIVEEILEFYLVARKKKMPQGVSLKQSFILYVST